MDDRPSEKCDGPANRRVRATLSPIAPHPSRLSRRDFLHSTGALLVPAVAASGPVEPGEIVNDVHAQLSETRVRRIVRPQTADDVAHAIRESASRGEAVSICGARHAMGGQPFGGDTLLLDMRALSRVRAFDRDRGLIDVESGIQWPELVTYLIDAQRTTARSWGIRQKQTGADRLTIGGAMAANAHGRGLTMAPFVGDIESFELIDASGDRRVCSRTSNPELFRLAIGGYGLWGVVTAATLRLAPRRKVQRIVEVRPVDGLMEAFAARIAEGFLFGDFQYAIDPASPDFMRKGVFSCYRPVPDDTPMQAQKELSDEDWGGLIQLAHTDRSRAFDRYATYYLSTSGQVYWSDVHQLSTYLDDYHRALDARAAGARGTEMITEIYVPRPALEAFFADVRETFRNSAVPIVYGTVRLIEQDSETVLPWARQPWACTIFNLHVEHTPAGIERAADAFRTLIDLGLKRQGSYFLTYHRYARRDQVEAAYPRFVEFLQLKQKYDPASRFQSDWWRHYRNMFADRLQRG
jgi:FAD/FMN-containing dehydrogenase